MSRIYAPTMRQNQLSKFNKIDEPFEHLVFNRHSVPEIIKNITAILCSPTPLATVHRIAFSAFHFELPPMTCNRTRQLAEPISIDYFFHLALSSPITAFFIEGDDCSNSFTISAVSLSCFEASSTGSAWVIPVTI